jgi:hypothetical protein
MRTTAAQKPLLCGISIVRLFEIILHSGKDLKRNCPQCLGFKGSFKEEGVFVLITKPLQPEPRNHFAMF